MNQAAVKVMLARMVTLLEPVTDGMIYYKNEPIGGMQNGRNIALRGEKLREYLKCPDDFSGSGQCIQSANEDRYFFDGALDPFRKEE